ncbi:NtaA/DmoA family FMN-dependent monooxygenase [Gordonia sp. Z-3]|uniref:NtaA/DmoA family FMN-dependent monooxygenase n=1 Tax=Gordonia sp. Z-3 TaxID=3115408 RepID=UPI002E29C7CC|nr:NtaA/DmoA family FMN-dependent monooxygenase [Gordonia sp. Z-3]MED5803841.1 NtaA/DmoA family FMN-dependent monooxygenase [Gordonia sp. Z-3]
MSDHMHLVGFLGTGPTVSHHGTWRYPTTENDYLDAEFLCRTAQTLERAKFDAVFYADSITFFEGQAETGGTLYMLDPVVVAAMVAKATSKIGIGLTVSTGFFEPYPIARSLATLDLLSGGRIAWNIVTGGSDAEARKIGQDGLPGRSERYERATEIVEACLKLWNSFPMDAVVADRQSGEFIDTSRLETFTYQGEHVRTEGYLSVPESPQQRPVLMQAGSSPQGRDVAARFAEVVFMIQRTAGEIRSFVDDMDTRLDRFGRSRKECAILPMVHVVVGETTRIAQEKWDLLNSLVNQDAAVAWTSQAAGVDLSGISADTPLQDIDLAAHAGGGGSTGYFNLLLQQADGREDMTLGEAAVLMTNSPAPALVGDPDEVADQMEELFAAGGSDGFMVSAPIMPGGFEDFARMVVPRLQARGLVQQDYPGSTLRETLFE